MKKIKTVLLIFVALILISGAAWGAYYVYESIYFFSTENAKITADTVVLTPEVTGRIKELNVKEGDYVKTGQILIKQDLSMLVTSSSINPQALASTADSIISKADVKAPIDGKVVKLNVVKGQVISPGMEIATIADISHIYVQANIEETEINKIKAGQKVDIKIDAYHRRSFEGYVESVGQATQTAFSQFPSLNTSGAYSKVTQLIPVKISIADADNLNLMLGMNATVKIHIKQ